MYIRFHCEGCGVEVFGFGRDTVPEKGFCATCEWLDEYLRGDLKEFWELYGHIAQEHGRRKSEPN